MDLKLLFWTGALANLALIVWCGARGIRYVRVGNVRTHRRMMLTCTALVAFFFLSYAAKVSLVGKEDRSAWAPIDYAVLYTHELCITLMLLAGLTALYQAWKFRKALGHPPTIPHDPNTARHQSIHRTAGTLAKWSGLFAFITAIGVWLSMLLRT